MMKPVLFSGNEVTRKCTGCGFLTTVPTCAAQEIMEKAEGFSRSKYQVRLGIFGDGKLMGSNFADRNYQIPARRKVTA
jgi:hypothetical protein